jgi:hypothetical protein
MQKYQEKMKDNPSSETIVGTMESDQNRRSVVEYRMEKLFEVQMKDGKDVEAHVTQWQELKRHEIVQQGQEQEVTEIVKSYANVMEEEEHNFRVGADKGARV